MTQPNHILLNHRIKSEDSSKIFSIIASFYEAINTRPGALVRHGMRVQHKQSIEDKENSIEFLTSLMDEWTSFPSDFDIFTVALQHVKELLRREIEYDGSPSYYDDIAFLMDNAKKVESSITQCSHGVELEFHSNAGTLSVLIKNTVDLLDSKGEVQATVTMRQAMFVIGINPRYSLAQTKGNKP